MATYQVSNPDRFTFSQPDEWLKWLRRFERFRSASGLHEKAEEQQVNTLVYTMGDEADDILISFKLSEEDRKKYEVVKDKFTSYFIKRRNVIYERARFNCRRQEEGEAVDAFIMDLHRLAEHCGFGELRDELIRDRIVVGLRDSRLSEKLQLQADLTLESAVTAARQTEQVKKQQASLKGELVGDGKQKQVDAVEKEKSQGKRHRKRGQHSKPPSTCTRCGRSPLHNKSECPAKDEQCHQCGKRGHFKRMCRNLLESTPFSRKPSWVR